MTPKTKGQDGGNRLTPKTSDSRNDTALSQELIHTVKPEIDLQSWASLGGNTKPSRTDRKPKRTWKRRAA